MRTGSNKKTKEKKPWSGRFVQPMARSVEEFTSSVHYDVRLFPQDITQSIAYARALVKAGVLNAGESQKIISGLESISRRMKAGKLALRPELEDVHMNIEMTLIEEIGEVGKKLHSGRSRNDQVATDLRMYLREQADVILARLKELKLTILDMAEKNIAVIMPGYTHLQRAQPVLFSHHLMAYYEMFRRDRERFFFVRKMTDSMPLGSGALAGTNFKIDRDALAKELGFSAVSKNSMDAVSDRDFVIDFTCACAVAMMHLSRFSEELITWSSYEFGFIELSDRYATGSSIMPQKKNPDVAELVRGKTGRVFGHLTGLLVMMKGLPLAYNRDMQEDKEAVFGALDTLTGSLKIFNELLGSVKINDKEMNQAAKKGYLTATDLAFYLVSRNVPFREAHEIVGKIVSYCEDSNMELEYLSLTQLKQFSEAFTYDATRILSAASSVAQKDMPGGTAPKRVKEAIKRARTKLLHDKA